MDIYATGFKSSDAEHRNTFLLSRQNDKFSSPVKLMGDLFQTIIRKGRDIVLIQPGAGRDAQVTLAKGIFDQSGAALAIALRFQTGSINTANDEVINHSLGPFLRQLIVVAIVGPRIGVRAQL